MLDIKLIREDVETFKERIKADHSVRVSRREGYTGGGGAFGPGMILLLLCLALGRRKYRTPSPNG